MIFVTVGTHYQGFDRLIKEMDEIADKTDEEVIAQIGSTKYRPQHMKYFTVIEEEKLIDFCIDARIIISHAGAGTVLTVLNCRKPLILVPRIKRYNEVIDNHQLELAKALENHENVIVVYDIENLRDALKKAEKLHYKEIKQEKALVIFLKEYIGKMKK